MSTKLALVLGGVAIVSILVAMLHPETGNFELWTRLRRRFRSAAGNGPPSSRW